MENTVLLRSVALSSITTTLMELLHGRMLKLMDSVSLKHSILSWSVDVETLHVKSSSTVLLKRFRNPSPTLCGCC